jgi:hypothetical protein
MYALIWYSKVEIYSHFFVASDKFDNHTERSLLRPELYAGRSVFCDVRYAF